MALNCHRLLSPRGERQLERLTRHMTAAVGVELDGLTCA